MANVVRRLLPYPQALKDLIFCKPVFVWKKQLNASWQFKVTYHLHLQGYESVNWLITLRTKAVHFFNTSDRNYPTTWCYNPGYMFPQQTRSINLKSLFSYCSEFISFRLFYFPHSLWFVDAWLIFMKEWNKSFHNIWRSISMTT
jgi:hypothetical protein